MPAHHWIINQDVLCPAGICRECAHRSSKEWEMKDEDKTKEQLLSELRALRRWVAESEERNGALPDATGLRRFAEQQLRANQTGFQYPQTKEDTERLIHALQVYKVQLEMQNEELRRIQQELQNDYRFLQTLIEAVPIPLFYKNVDGKYLGCNDAFAEFLGKSKDDIIGKSVHEVSLKYLADKYYEMDMDLFVSPGTQEYEGQVKHGDGSIRIVVLNKATFHDQDGQLIGLIGAMVDITERKMAEEALRESEAQKQAILDGITSNIAFVNNQLEIVWANKTAAKSVNKTPEEMIGHKCHEFWADKMKPCDGCPTLRAFETKQSVHATMVTPDGKIWDESGEPVFDKKGNLIGVVEVAHDITKFKRAEQALRESETHFRELFNAAAMPLAFVSSDGTVENLNRSFLQDFGYTIEDIPTLGEWWKLSCPDPDYRQWVVSNWEVTVKSAVKEKTNIEPIECLVTCKNGEIRTVVISGSIIGDHFLATFFDITKSKRAEDKLRQSEYNKKIQNQIANVFLTIPDEEMYGEVLAIVIQALKSKFGVFGFIETNGDLVIPSMTREIWNECQVPEKSIVFPLDKWGDSLWGEAIREKKGLYSNGPFHTPEGHVHINNFITVPIVYGNETIGLISVANNERGYTEEDKGFLESIANYISPILNARRQRDRHEQERTRAETELQQSNEILQAIIEAAPTAIIGLDLNGKVQTVWNRAAEKMLGWSAQEVMGQFLPSVSVENREEFRRFRELIRSGKTLGGIDVCRQRRDGSPIDYSIYASPLHDAEGHISGNIAVLVDITKRKQMERQLILREQEYRTLLESVPDFIVRYDSNLRRIYVNPAWEKASGLSAAEVIGVASNDIPRVPSPVADEYVEILRQVMETGITQNVEFTWVNAYGVELFLEYIIVPEYDPHGRVAGVLAVGRDITERKQAEESILKLSQAIEQSPASIVITDLGGRIEFVNAKFTQITGYTYAEALGQNPRILKSDETSTEEYKRLWKTISSGGVWRGEFHNRKKNSELFWESATIAPVRNADNVITHYVAVKEDITERKKLEEELRHAKKIEAVGTLAGGIAHEFNNILGIILGNAELAKDDIPEWNPARFNLDEIKASSLRARDVVRQLLTFSRKTEEDRRPLDLAPVVKEAMKFFKSLIPANIEIRQNIDEECHMVIAAPTQIHQIMLNLSTNAAHAMEETGGILEFTLQNIKLGESTHGFDTKLPPGEYVMLELSDTGCGIPAEIVDRIFDPYFTTKEVGKGTGMGLSVVHGIVEAYGGSIQVQSDPDKGTMFKIFFPAAKEDTKAAVAISEELPPGTERVLFIDDEQALARLGRLMLEALGYQVQAETNPRKALELFAANPEQFDLIITDTAMPGITGDQLITHVLQIRSDMKIILCTGYSQRVDEGSARAIGAKAYALKPFDRKQLAMTVRKVLDERI